MELARAWSCVLRDALESRSRAVGCPVLAVRGAGGRRPWVSELGAEGGRKRTSRASRHESNSWGLDCPSSSSSPPLAPLNQHQKQTRALKVQPNPRDSRSPPPSHSNSPPAFLHSVQLASSSMVRTRTPQGRRGTNSSNETRRRLSSTSSPSSSSSSSSSALAPTSARPPRAL